MKRINPTPEDIDKAVEEVRELLTKGKQLSNTIKLSIDLVKPDTEKAELIVTPIVKEKIAALVDIVDTEVAWHCTVERGEKANQFLMTDIVMFPQIVSGGTVQTDDVKYTQWLYSLPIEQFDHLRFHGHSHVNMAVSPSGVDLTYQTNLLTNVTDFYIFGIYNKRGTNNLIIYDVENNLIYEDKDIEYIEQDTEVELWVKDEVEQNCEKRVYTPPKTAKKTVMTTAPYQGVDTGHATPQIGSMTPGEKMIVESYTDSIMNDTPSYTHSGFYQNSCFDDGGY